METRESVNTERVGTLAADSHQFDMIGELTIVYLLESVTLRCEVGVISPGGWWQPGGQGPWLGAD